MARPGLERLGPYQLVRNLTRPGRAEVYVGHLNPETEAKAREQLSKLPEVAVIKVLRPPDQVDPGNMPRVQEAMARFIEEGRLGTRLRHPSLTRTFGVALDRRQNQHFIIQEFVDGITLAQILDHCAAREIPLPYSTILRLVIPILKALHYAHHDALREDGRPLRVVHRDIKPANVMLTYEGRVVLLDLASARSTSFTRQATVQDVVMGTAHYLAPEQVFETEQVNHQTDIFATGVVLYELAALMPLLPRTRKLSEIANALARFDFNDHSQYIDEGRYPGLRAVLAKSLRAKPAERYTTAGEMARELEGLLLKAGDGQSLGAFATDLHRQWEGEGEPAEVKPAPIRPRATGANIASNPNATPEKVREPERAPVEVEKAAPVPIVSTPSTESAPSAPAPVVAPPVSPALPLAPTLNQTGVLELPSPVPSSVPAQPARNWGELVMAGVIGVVVALVIFYGLGALK